MFNVREEALYASIFKFSRSRKFRSIPYLKYVIKKSENFRRNFGIRNFNHSNTKLHSAQDINIVFFKQIRYTNSQNAYNKNKQNTFIHLTLFKREIITIFGTKNIQ